jgi:hypothetical protein
MSAAFVSVSCGNDTEAVYMPSEIERFRESIEFGTAQNLVGTALKDDAGHWFLTDLDARIQMDISGELVDCLQLASDSTVAISGILVSESLVSPVIQIETFIDGQGRIKKSCSDQDLVIEYFSSYAWW